MFTPIAIPFHTAGGPIDLANLRDRDMTAEAIGEALSRLPRYNGRTPIPWSVAAHSLLVEAICPPDLRAWGLLHDAHEAFLGDITTPALELLCLGADDETVIQIAVDRARNRLDFAIARAWCTANRSQSLALKQADWIALQVEMSVFFGVPLAGLTPEELRLADRALTTIEALPRIAWWHVRDAWIERAHALAAEGRLRPPPGPPAGTPASLPDTPSA